MSSIITEVKFLEDQNEAAFTGENQSMINHVENNVQRQAHARHDCMITVSEISLNTALPFNVVFDKNMCIKIAGLHLRTLCNENSTRANKNK